MDDKIEALKGKLDCRNHNDAAALEATTTSTCYRKMSSLRCCGNMFKHNHPATRPCPWAISRVGVHRLRTSVVTAIG
jgi:hypothetical protein